MRVPINKLNSAGFTLIEALVALAVLAVAASGAARVIADAYNHVGLTERYQRAHYLADSHLRSLSLQQLSPGISRGVYIETDYHAELPWELRLEQLRANDMPKANSDISKKVRALRAELSVELPDQGRSVLLSTLLLVAPDEAELPALSEFETRSEL